MDKEFKTDDWRALRVGDGIRIVAQPTCFGTFAPETVLAPNHEDFTDD